MLGKFPFIILVFLFLTGCNSKHEGEKKTSLISNLIDISENEDKGIKEIIAFYGGECEYGITKKVFTDSKNQTNFWLKFGKSEEIDSLATKAELPGSNIAYIFYKNLDAEKNKYSQIETELLFQNGGNMKFSYSISQLEKVKNKFFLANKIVSILKNKDFETLKTYFKIDTSLFNFGLEEAMSDLKKAENTFGKIVRFVPYGFSFEKTYGTKEILHLSGAIIRDTKSNYFSINVDPDLLEDKIYTINYNL
jgi:hypothetical protein